MPPVARGSVDAADQPPSRVRQASWAAVLALLAVQAFLQGYFFPLSELIGNKPLYYIDSAFHQYQMELARQLCQQYRLVGYDPFFAAGQLGGVSFNASAKFPALMACLVGSPESVVPAYKLFSFTMGLLAPVAMVLAARMLDLGRTTAWLLGALSLLLWWTGPLRWYHTAGLVSYVAIAYWSIAFAAAFSKVCQAPSAIRVTGIALAAALGLFVHPLFAVAAVLLCAPLVLSDPIRHGGVWRIAKVSAVVALVALAANLPWLYATISLPNIASSQPYQRLVDPLLVIQEPLGIAPTASGGSRLYGALVISAIAAAALSRGQARRIVLAFIGSSVLLMAWASFGALSPSIAALQPNRFSALAWLALAVPAAHGAALLAAAWAAPRGERRTATRVSLITATLAIAAISGYFVREAALEVFSSRAARYAVARPEVKGEGPLSTQLVDWIRTHTDTSARVLFENSLARVHDHAHIAGLLALQTQREFIGGPYPFTDFASAWDGVAFAQPLTTLPPPELVRLLDLYNVKWMLCHSAQCRSAMAALPGVVEVATLGTVVAFERPMTPSYFISGDGSVRARCINRVDIEAHGAGPLVLKYHWVPGLVAVPPMDIGKRYFGGDPRPFIEIERPAMQFSLGVGAPATRCDPSNRGM